MIKVGFFSSASANGPAAIPLFVPGCEEAFEKTAAPNLLPEVSKYISTLTPKKGSIYVLVNALGAGEFWGSNVNGDYFPEEGLIHRPSDWAHNPVVDRIRSASWPYGFPTFYEAQPFAHHRNKDMSKGFGGVELAAWHDDMKRVELIARVDQEKCLAFGGAGVWDKLEQGQFPDVSMGCKVPFDTCSICLDWEEYKKALATFQPGRHKHPGEAVLAWHRKLIQKRGHGIRGLSITRADYCEHARDSMNKILPDGRKVFVYNDFPKFFDISFVFIGADKTAKTMLKIAEAAVSYWDMAPSFAIGASLEEERTKVASAREEELLKVAFLGKDAKLKASEITKDTIPSQFAAKAVPLVTGSEGDLPNSLLDALGARPFSEALSSLSTLGITLRPREFQRVVIINFGKPALADELDRNHVVFPRVEEEAPEELFSGRAANSALLRLLLPFLEGRSVFGPPVEARTIRVLLMKAPTGSSKKLATPSSLSHDLLRKIGAAYNTYRREQMNKVASAQDKIAESGLSDRALVSLAQLPTDKLFTPMSAAHLKLAYWGEVGTLGDEKAIIANVERGLPSKNTSNTHVSF